MLFPFERLKRISLFLDKRPVMQEARKEALAANIAQQQTEREDELMQQQKQAEQKWQ
jgi:hypothetical protein